MIQERPSLFRFLLVSNDCRAGLAISLPVVAWLDSRLTCPWIDSTSRCGLAKPSSTRVRPKKVRAFPCVEERCARGSGQQLL